MRCVLLIAVVFVVTAFSQAACGDEAEWSPLTITAPTPDQSLLGLPQVSIRWEHTFGGDVKSSVVYSFNGEVFDREIASKLDTCECVWQPQGGLPPLVWIKVKLYREGYMLAQSTVRVKLIPATSVVVSKFNQKVFHFVEGELKSVYTCSTALPKYDLAAGSYKVYLREKKHWSREYELWMPHSLFFHGGYALHATQMIRQLGRPASHGCVRLHPRDAESLYNQVTVGTPVIVLPKTTDCTGLLQLKRQDKAATCLPSLRARGEQSPLLRTRGEQSRLLAKEG